MRRLALALALALAFAVVFGASSARAQSAAIAQPIVNGRAAAASEMEGTVGVLDASTLDLFCTGTLVSPSVVVTAAHCFFDSNGFAVAPTSIVVAFGELDLTSPPPVSNLVAVVAGGPNPDYAKDPAGDEQPNGLDPTARDVGYLVLARDLVEVTPIPIATSSESSRADVAGTTVTLAGFGVNDLTTLAYGVLMETSGTIEVTTDNELLVAPESPTQGDTCFGDSGGPAYLTIDGALRLVGVTSRGRADSPLECGAGGIYTLASKYRSWIASASGDPRVAPSHRAARCDAGGAGRAELSVLVAIAAAFVALVVLARRARRVTGS